jgi:hypothetical protein
MKRKEATWIQVAAVFALIPALAIAQQSNEGATVVAPFTANPPTIDGQVTPGEWDAAAVAPGAWTAHDSTTPADATEPTVIKVMYDVLGLYILFDRTDKNVECGTTDSERLQSGPGTSPYYTPAAGVGWNFWEQDYCAIYVDPAGTGQDFYSYSIQAEPSMSALGETAVDYLGNSYTYTEVGQYGGMKRRFENPAEDLGLPDEVDWEYWSGGASWDLKDSKIADGLRDGGYYMEMFIAYTDLNSYYDAYSGETFEDIIFGTIAEVNLMFPADPGYGMVKQPKGILSGMPAPGTEWDINFCVHSFSMTGPQYVNWVGDSGGFVTRPFGKLVFGAAEPSEVEAEITAIYYADNMVHIEWDGPAGKTHLVQAADELSGQWTTIATIASAPAQNSLDIALEGSEARFFRVMVE